MSTVVSFRYKGEGKPEDLSSYTKSIRLQKNGFCIALYNGAKNDVYLIEQRDFEDNYPLKEQMNLLLETESKWQTEGNLFFSYFTQINTQIPENLYNEEDKDCYLSMTTEHPTDYISVKESVCDYKLVNVSGWNKEIYKNLMLFFPKYTYRSGLSTLMKYNAKRHADKKISLFIESNCFHVVAAKGNIMLGANCFSFENKEDFMYYLAGFAYTLFGNLKDIELNIAGNIENESLLFKSMQKYFTNIQWINYRFNCTQSVQNRFCDILYEE